MITKAHGASIAELEEVIDQIIPTAMTNTLDVQATALADRVAPLIRSG